MIKCFTGYMFRVALLSILVSFTAVAPQLAHAQWGELGGTNTSIFEGTIRTITKDAKGNIYTAGSFANNNGYQYVSKWDGSTWTELGGANTSTFNGGIYTLTADANGNIYAGGFFRNNNGNFYIAKWDGSTWTELGGTNKSTFDGYVYSIITDANGKIYAAGNFINGSGIKYIAKWDGSTWSELGGTNTSTFNDDINILNADVNGNIYATGLFTNAFGNHYVAKWDGSAWTEVGGTNTFNGNIYSLTIDLSGNIYAGGDFTNSNSDAYVAKWDGNFWSELGGANTSTFSGYIKAITIDASGNIYAADNTIPTRRGSSKGTVTQWNGNTWTVLVGYGTSIFNNRIFTLNTDSNGIVYAAGDFINSNLKPYVAKYTPLPDYTWTGTTSTDWSDASNWSNNKLPTKKSDVTIPASATRQPVLSGDVQINGLNNSGSLSLNDHTLEIDGQVTGKGVLNGSALSWLGVFGGYRDTLYFGNGATDSLLYTFAIGDQVGTSVVLGSGLGITGILHVPDTLYTNNHLTLKSTSIANTATTYITNNIVGNVTLERFIPNSFRMYRDLTIGTTNTGTFYNNWQEGGKSPAGYGIYITGAGGAANGFDASVANNPSLYTFNNNTQSWSAITNTNTTISPFTGYRTLVRGDRSFSLANPPGQLLTTTSGAQVPFKMADSTVIRTTGTILNNLYGIAYTDTGVIDGNSKLISKSFKLADPVTYPNGYSLVGNPYWANYSLDLSRFSVGLNTTFNYLDPTLTSVDPATGSPVTSYVAFNTTTGVKSNVSSEVTIELQPGQAVFVQNDGTGTKPYLNFNPNYIDYFNSHTNVFGATKTYNRVYASIWRNLPVQGLRNIDGTVAVFDNAYTKNIDKEDSKKILNAAGNIFINHAGTTLSIDGLPTPTLSDSINLGLSSLTANEPYILQFNAKELATPGLDAYLVDNFLKTTTKLNSDITTINFSPTKNAASYANRFVVAFKPSTTPLAVKFTAVKAQKADKAINVSWQTANEEGLSTYTVERGNDGKSFTAIGTQSAKNTASATYTLVDSKPLTGNNYYRIKVTEANGTISYSNIVVVNMTGVKGDIKVYPNPVVGKTFTIQMNNLEKGNYSIRLVNTIGQVVVKQTLTHEGGSVSKAVAIENSLTTGNYSLLIQTQEGVTVSETSLFVK